MEIGQWIAITEDGLWYSPFTGACTFETKAEAVSSIRDATMDRFKNPHVARLESGRYLYTVGDCDAREVYEEFWISLLTRENIEDFRRLERTSEEDG